ncbi:class I SAM-dependent methyltransferase [Candidatus Collinsella stercoripullorum]|uniref:class I SAM-dependent methyltransferase n=1 Tax=Candidatus Collinsella stercoripullorum TaxID=2838522 RepID=UPI0022E077E3|nr:class I SAM-dependent methyltransferase [Candidatus Collinsella stercoripullorum]
METLEFNDSNKMQQYSTHAVFRYFGKLPPTLVAKLLDTYNPQGGRTLELMCGSGTAMLEAKLRGIEADGIDINPLSVMVSNMKNTFIPEGVLDSAIESFVEYTQNVPQGAYTYFRPKTRNLNRWFTERAQRECSAIRYFIDCVDTWVGDEYENELRDFLLVSFAGIIRKVSNASERTGRIFRCNGNCPLSPFEEMLVKLKANEAAVQTLDPSAPLNRAIVGDARHTPFADGTYDFVLNHPPYFALYKYSSDVLRFELEWLDINRKSVASGEIEDGFKTTDASLVYKYIDDMKDVFKEMHRLLSSNGLGCVVVSNSTLREEQLPVIDGLIPSAESVGLTLEEHKVRPVSFAQASYHKSANPRIKTNEDHVLIFKRS